VDLADDLSLACSIAADADLVAGPRFRAADLRVEAKPDRSPVTDADRAVERLIRERIAAARPGDGVYGEEFGTVGDPEGRGRQWIIDPIDGTANFLRGVPVWATLIGLAIDGVPVVGVVSAPALGLRWWAARGLGAWVDRTDGPHGDAPRRMRVSGVERIEDAYFSHGAIRLWEDLGRGAQLAAIAREVWRDHGYGDFWQHMLVAEGLIDAAAEFDVQPYDVAAIAPIVEEAGGRFSDADGTAGPWGGSALSTNGLLHETFLDRLRA